MVEKAESVLGTEDTLVDDMHVAKDSMEAVRQVDKGDQDGE
jgi:hypothetical protein